MDALRSEVEDIERDIGMGQNVREAVDRFYSSAQKVLKTVGIEESARRKEMENKVIKLLEHQKKRVHLKN
ncbi:Hypothetical protein FKW44_001250 [Caligus rogercresseyi]|uniref:Uncharacterized protein n=1 Tax=Caligus rogercresseyi TaxID=217165 RepID=A0A7T8QVH2_CALRO|nr:Hypothetical protein FKW44_001250 [Caligus rogercresseyi]